MRIDPLIQAVLDKYGLPKTALWDCHGTLVMYHKYVEQVAATAKIMFGVPTVIEGSAEKGIVALLVSGQIHDGADTRTEWSIGEAAPNNNKNAYPYAMAEKRAKDRVALKLLGLHGLVFSEEEADDFKKSHGELVGPLGKTELKTKMREFAGDLAACEDEDSIIALVESAKDTLDQCARDLPDWYYGKANSDVSGVIARIDERKAELAAKQFAEGEFNARL